MHIFFKNIFSRLILISSKFLYPRHIIIFYFKKVYVLHFLIKHLIKTFIFKYIQMILILDFIGIENTMLTHILILENLNQES